MTDRAQRLLDAIRELPPADRLRLVERVVHELAEGDAASSPRAPIGLFADEPELVAGVCEAAMQARERDSLRT